MKRDYAFGKKEVRVESWQGKQDKAITLTVENWKRNQEWKWYETEGIPTSKEEAVQEEISTEDKITVWKEGYGTRVCAMPSKIINGGSATAVYFARNIS